MGSSKTVVQESRTQTQTATPTAEETELNKLELERRRQLQPLALESDKALLELIRPLSKGQNLPGIFGSLGQGVPEDIQNDIIQKSLADIAPQFQQLGILNSGPAAQISARLASDIRTQSFFEGTRQRENLLNILQGFPATAQAPALQESAVLAQQLAGLRSLQGTGFGTSTTKTPFFQTAFAGGIGQGIGASLMPR